MTRVATVGNKAEPSMVVGSRSMLVRSGKEKVVFGLWRTNLLRIGDVARGSTCTGGVDEAWGSVGVHYA